MKGIGSFCVVNLDIYDVKKVAISSLNFCI